jgi:hypothetical protein
MKKTESDIAEKIAKDKITKLKVYMDDGNIYQYEIPVSKVREHSSAIIKTGYRHNNGELFEHYPPHRILKVKCDDRIDTNYTDTQTGT